MRAARIDRVNREYWRDDSATLIKRRQPPINLVGGHGFPDAPIIDISSTAPNIGKTALPTMERASETERRSMPSQ